MIAKHCPGKPKGKPVGNRPPLNMLGDTKHVQSAHEHEHLPEKPEGKPGFNRPSRNMLADTLVIHVQARQTQYKGHGKHEAGCTQTKQEYHPKKDIDEMARASGLKGGWSCQSSQHAWYRAQQHEHRTHEKPATCQGPPRRGDQRKACEPR